ncbi:hypothetical protein CLOM_g2916 [Closterium sp. NIES-68]|nr:hypothetical protein CLOM_g2916 [Closterium sp. NIES-68]GJP79069.1 hypothetical protein CLOP_g9314 [Closterium sp. NIES-67]
MVHLTELRIVLPFTLEEFKRGQRYANWKTNEDATEPGQGGTLLSSAPYYHEQHGEGLFTHSLFRLGNRLPDWVNRLVPPSALVVDEKSWINYPYFRTIITIPFFSKLRMEIETIHLPDDGSHPNALGLSAAELAMRRVDWMDIGSEPVARRDYKAELDPQLVKSKLTGRGPLTPGWQQREQPLMCAYKVVRAQAEYWGVQNSAERLLINSLRQIFLLAHKNCFGLLDQWYPLSLEEIIAIADKHKPPVAIPKPPPLPEPAAELEYEPDVGEGRIARNAVEEGREGRRDGLLKMGSESEGGEGEEEEGEETEESEGEDDDWEDDVEFYEAQMQWAAEEELYGEKILSDLGHPLSLCLEQPPPLCPLCCARSQQGGGPVGSEVEAPAAPPEPVPAPAVFCVTCAEFFCHRCFQEFHITPRLQQHATHPMAPSQMLPSSAPATSYSGFASPLNQNLPRGSSDAATAPLAASYHRTTPSSTTAATDRDVTAAGGSGSSSKGGKRSSGGNTGAASGADARMERRRQKAEARGLRERVKEGEREEREGMLLAAREMGEGRKVGESEMGGGGSASGRIAASRRSSSALNSRGAQVDFQVEPQVVPAESAEGREVKHRSSFTRWLHGNPETLLEGDGSFAAAITATAAAAAAAAGTVGAAADPSAAPSASDTANGIAASAAAAGAPGSPAGAEGVSQGPLLATPGEEGPRSAKQQPPSGGGVRERLRQQYGGQPVALSVALADAIIAIYKAAAAAAAAATAATAAPTSSSSYRNPSPELTTSLSSPSLASLGSAASQPSISARYSDSSLAHIDSPSPRSRSTATSHPPLPSNQSSHHHHHHHHRHQQQQQVAVTPPAPASRSFSWIGPRAFSRSASSPSLSHTHSTPTAAVTSLPAAAPAAPAAATPPAAAPTATSLDCFAREAAAVAGVPLDTHGDDGCDSDSAAGGALGGIVTVTDVQLVLDYLASDAGMAHRHELQRFRILSELLAEVQPQQLGHAERLAFWINVYNALAMHAYLVYGLPRNHYKRVMFMHKSAYIIAGLPFSILAIEHSILRAASFQPALAGLLPVQRYRRADVRYNLALDRPEPLVTFALSCGCSSAPPVRVYHPDTVHEQLRTAAQEYIRANVKLHPGSGKILLPKLLHWYSKDFARNAAGLLQWAAEQMEDGQKENILHAIDAAGASRKVRMGKVPVQVLGYDWSFQYVLV